mgnify:CR=1 FL=1
MFLFLSLENNFYFQLQINQKYTAKQKKSKITEKERKRSNDDQCKSIRKTYLKLWRIIAKPMPVKNDKIEQIK